MALARWLLVMAVLTVIGSARAQSSDFLFAPRTNPPLTVFVHAPEVRGPETRVVIALLGLLRQGGAVLKAWTPLADRYGFIVVVPQFDDASYKGSANYNTGRVLTAGRRNDPATWSFAVIEELFDEVKTRYGLKTNGYTVFGHSAGAQFTHRFLQLVPGARVDRAIAANAGWYTMMDPMQPYPWGLGGLGLQPDDECRAFSRALVLLLGDADTDPNHDQLNREPQAMTQGLHRFARGQNFFSASRERAKALGCDFAWTLRSVAGVGHEFDKMAAAAAALLHNKEQR
jgi:poly(3-hydroxybutyrate) depolymerase